MSELFLHINNEHETSSLSLLSPLKGFNGLHQQIQPSMNSNRVLSSISIPDPIDNINHQSDPRYNQFKELIEKRDINQSEHILSIEDQELIASILYDFHHFKILIRQQKRLEFSQKLFKHIHIGYLERGEFFFHKGDSNKTDLICILSGKAAVFQKKSESYINQEMNLLGRIVNLNQQIVKIEKSVVTNNKNRESNINNEMSDAIHQLKQKIEHAEEKLDLLRSKEEDDLLKAYNYQKYFLTENVSSFRRVKYAEHGTTLGEAQVVNGCVCESTVVCVQKCFYFYISSQAYREIFGLEITKNAFICDILKQNFPGAKDDSLRRVSYDFREEIYEYNKVIFEENDQANLFMIVRQGEVEARRRIDVQINDQQAANSNGIESGISQTNIQSSQQQIQQQQLSPLASPSSATSFFGQNNQKLVSQKDQQPTCQQLLKKFKGKNAYKEISIGILGEGQILGFEDAYNNRKTRSFKAISKTNETIIYYINKKQLDDVILLNDDYKLKKGIKNQSKHKSEYYDNRTDNLINFEQANLKSKENHILQENMKKQYLPESKNFKYLISSWMQQTQTKNNEENQKQPMTNSILRSKMSAPTLLPNFNFNQEEPSNSSSQNDQNSEKNQIPTKFQRTQIKSLSNIPINPSNFEVSSPYFENNNSQDNLESPPRRRYKLLKEDSAQQQSSSSQKLVQTKSISMHKLEDYLFKSDIEIINEQIEMKEKWIQFQQQQREKQGYINTKAISPSSNQLSSQQNSQNTNNPTPNQQNFESHQTQYEQQLFEETKKRLLFLKNFSNENKKNYRLKSEHSLLNSILKKTSALKLNFPIKSFKNTSQDMNNISQGSDENQKNTPNNKTNNNSNSQNIPQKRESISLFSKRGSEVLASPKILNDFMIEKRFSEHHAQQQPTSTFHISKQILNYSQHQPVHCNGFNQIKSLQNLSSFSSQNDLNHIQNHLQSQQSSSTMVSQQNNPKSNQKLSKNDQNICSASQQNYPSTLESIIENQTQSTPFNKKNNIQFPHLKIKNSNLNLASNYFTQPSSPLIFQGQSNQYGFQHPSLNNLNEQCNLKNQNSIQDLQYSPVKLGSNFSCEQLENKHQSNSQESQIIPEQGQLQSQPSDQISSTISQLPQISNKSNDQSKESQINTFSNNDNIKQGIQSSISSTNPSFIHTDFPSISHRSSRNPYQQQIHQIPIAKQEHSSGVIPLKSPLNQNIGFTDIVKRIGVDPQIVNGSQKFQLLKNISSLKQKVEVKNNSKLLLNSHPLQQKYKKNQSTASLLSNKTSTNREVKEPYTFANFRNESPLMIGKINYSQK